MNGGVNTAKIFYVKPEPVFMKYADEEAKAYHDMETEREVKRAEKRGQEPRGGKQGGGFRSNQPRRNDQVESLDQVSKNTGISFGGRP